jgi:hypothetical protein
MRPLLTTVMLLASAAAFAPSRHQINLHRQRTNNLIIMSRSTSQETMPYKPNSEPRTGFAQQLLNFALASPLWEFVLVPQARASIVKTAEGILYFSSTVFFGYCISVP